MNLREKRVKYQKSINNTSNNQRDSQQEMNNLNLGKTNSIEKQMNNVKMKKKDRNIIIPKTTFNVILLKKM